jgi:hypothetical protein
METGLIFAVGYCVFLSLMLAAVFLMKGYNKQAGACIVACIVFLLYMNSLV